MRTYLLKREQYLAQPADKVFAFFADAANLELITPPWLQFRIRTPTPVVMAVGARIAYQIRWRIVLMTWQSEIVEWDPPRRFTDVQLRGPYALWHHAHSFIPENGGTRIVDKIRYGLPLGPLGAIAHRLKVRRDLQAIFDYRALRIREILESIAPLPGLPASLPTEQFVNHSITGSTQTAFACSTCKRRNAGHGPAD